MAARSARTVIAGLTAALLGAAQALAATQSLVILHENDIHGHLRSFCYVEVAKGPQEHCDVGGAARRATLIRRLKARAGATPVLVIDAGDTSTRGPLITEYEGVDEVEAMNALGVDMAAVGNNEFKLRDGVDSHDATGAQAALQRLVHRARFPWLCANATDANGAPLPGVQPFVVRQFGPLRVAFLGLTTIASKDYAQVKGLVIGDPVEAAKVWIPRARAEADVVVAVTHLGVDEDHRLVRETRGIDAVVGGHSHTFLYQPAVEKNLDGVDTPIVQDGEFGVRLGEMHLTFEGDAAGGWKLASFTDRLAPVDANVRPDPALAALAQRYAAPLDVTVGTLPLIPATVDGRARMTAETLAAAWKAAAGADVGVATEGSLFGSFHVRRVTRYQVREVVPFHDMVVRVDVPGARLRQFLTTPNDSTGAIRATIGADQIDPAKTYRVASTTFIARAFGAVAEATGVDARTAVERWLGRR